MRMVKLTDNSGNNVYINPEHVVSIRELDEDRTLVAIAGDNVYHTFNEPVIDVLRKITAP